MRRYWLAVARQSATFGLFIGGLATFVVMVPEIVGL